MIRKHSKRAPAPRSQSEALQQLNPDELRGVTGGLYSVNPSTYGYMDWTASTQPQYRASGGGGGMAQASSYSQPYGGY